MYVTILTTGQLYQYILRVINQIMRVFYFDSLKMYHF